MLFRVLHKENGVVIASRNGVEIVIPSSVLSDAQINIDSIRVFGVIRLHIQYGCCKLFDKYRTTFAGFVDEIEFCPFCGTKLKEEKKDG